MPRARLWLFVSLSCVASCGSNRVPDPDTDSGPVEASDAGGEIDMALTGGDAGSDGGTDATTDTDADADTHTDAGTDTNASTDAGLDAGTDAGTGTDTDAGTDAGNDAGSDAGTDAGSDAYVPFIGGNTLWIGNSLIRHSASGPYPAYDVAAVVQDLHTASGRAGRQTMRVLAQDGFDLFGWWTTWYGYARPDGEVVTAARAITEDGAAARTYDPALAYTALDPGQRWNRIVLLSTANHFVTPDRWYGPIESGAIVPNMERWYSFVEAVDPSIELLHYEGPVDSREMGLQTEVDALYAELQSRWAGRIVPVGRAFVSASSMRPSLDLRRSLADDYMHFSEPGVYLAACVFFAVLYGDPTGLPVTSGLTVSPADATFLQRVAADAVTAVGSAPP